MGTLDSILERANRHVEVEQEQDQSMVGDGTILVDYKAKDYRSFCFCIHPAYGLLLLHCTRKKNKLPHYQLPGGHIDEPEFADAGQFLFF